MLVGPDDSTVKSVFLQFLGGTLTSQRALLEASTVS